MKVREVFQHERDALLGEFAVSIPLLHTEVLPYAAVTEPDVLVRTPTFLRTAHPVMLESLSGRDRKMAFVQVCPSLKYKFLWVHADNDAYRDDYKTFLRTFHNVTEELPSNLAVDHLYNRDRAKSLGAPYIRMVLAESSINSSHGAGYEKSRSKSGLGAIGRDHTMDTLILMKLCGMPSPRKGQPLTAAMRAHIQSVSARYGIPVDELENDIEELMKVAAFKPRG